MAGFFTKWKRLGGDFNSHDILFGREWKKYFGTPDPEPAKMDPNDYEWDPETGMPIGLNQLPEGHSALLFQQRSKEIVAQRNAALKRQALGYLELASRSGESFRPGGYAGGSAQSLRDMASISMSSQITEPDLMSGAREFAANDAIRKQEQEAAYAQNMQIASLIASLYGGGGGGMRGSSGGGGALYDRGYQGGTYQPSTNRDPYSNWPSFQ